MSMVLIEADELQKMINSAVTNALKNVGSVKDDPLFLTTKDFAENVGLTFAYFRDNVLYHPDFQKAIIQKDRKKYVKKQIGRKIVEEILNEHRR